MHGLSVIVITRDEEQDIAACLDSVKGLASEIVVVDSGSVDRTIEICHRYTNRVLHRDWSGYSAQKQFALQNATGPWVLNIDADERVSPELAQEIRSELSAPTLGVNGFQIPFRHYVFGRRLRFGGAQGELHTRLFRRDRAAYGAQPIHEGIRVDPPVGRLKGCIDHYSYRNMEEYMRKCNEYTSLIAREKYGRGARFRFWHHARLPYEFFVRFVLKLGFLDGKTGLTYALLSSYYVWLKYAKLKDLETLP